MMDRRIGAQLYNVRKDTQTAEEMDKALARLHDMGYKTMQVSGVGPIPAEKIAELAKKYDMEIMCTHRDFGEYADDTEAAIKFHETLGCKLPGIGMLPGGFERSEAGFRQFARALRPVIAKMKEHGLPLLYHNHAFEFEKTNSGKTFFDILIEETELDFIVDVYWVIDAGVDPAKFIRQLGSRAKVIHFKDKWVKANVREMCPIMEGNLDWDAIIEACDEAGSLWAAVEHDVCNNIDPYDSMEISYNNLKTKGFC